MRFTGVMATTELAKRGDIYVQFSVESLESAQSAVEGVPWNHGHNPLLLPLGKMERAWVEKRSETEASLHQTTYAVTDDPESFVHELSGTPLVCIPFTDSPSRFSLPSVGANPSISVDMSAVRAESQEALVQEIRAHDENINLGFHDRQEAIPIPLVQFVSDMSLVDALMNAVKIAVLGAGVRAAARGTLLAWAEETVKWIKNDCIPALMAYRRRKTEASIAKGSEWIVLVFDARSSDGPMFELVIPSEHDSEMPEGFVEKFAEQIKSFSGLLPECDKIVFAYDQQEEKCEFRYALTKTGGVIGSEVCYQESVLPHRQWLAAMEAGTSLWWTLVTRDNGQLAIQLYSLGGDQPRYLGWMYVSPDDAARLLEVIDADDGRLRPWREAGDSPDQS